MVVVVVVITLAANAAAAAVVVVVVVVTVDDSFLPFFLVEVSLSAEIELARMLLTELPTIDVDIPCLPLSGKSSACNAEQEIVFGVSLFPLIVLSVSDVPGLTSADVGYLAVTAFTVEFVVVVAAAIAVALAVIIGGGFWAGSILVVVTAFAGAKNNGDGGDDDNDGAGAVGADANCFCLF